MRTLRSLSALDAHHLAQLVDDVDAQFQSALTVKPELKRLLAAARAAEVSEAVLQEQRVSFAFGNAPESNLITKDSVRHSSERIRLQ